MVKLSIVDRYPGFIWKKNIKMVASQRHLANALKILSADT